MSSISASFGVQQAVAYAVARKSMDAWKAQGEAAVALIAAAGQTAPAQAPPAGRLDVTG